MLHDGQYVVRAVAMAEGQRLATAMAAHTDLETAEERAQTRLLSLLGITPTAAETATAAATPLTNHEPAAKPALPVNRQPIAQPPAAPIAPPAKPTPPIGPATAPAAAVIQPMAASIAPAAKATHPPVAAAPETKATLETALETSEEAAASSPPSTLAMHTLETLETSASPVDLSDIIAQIDVEMTRLSWSNQQGREYLEKTYGKRSRQQLSDEELLGFLLYLESQPTPAIS